MLMSFTNFIICHPAAAVLAFLSFFLFKWKNIDVTKLRRIGIWTIFRTIGVKKGFGVIKPDRTLYDRLIGWMNRSLILLPHLAGSPDFAIFGLLIILIHVCRLNITLQRSRWKRIALISLPPKKNFLCSKVY